MKSIQLAFLPASPGEDWRTLTLETRAPNMPSQVLVVPGAMVLCRTVEAQGRTDAQARAAALASLVDELAAPIGSCICALSPQGPTRRLAFVASRQAIEACIAEARTHGFYPDAIVPDFALLAASAEGVAMVASRGADTLARTASGGFACQTDLASLLTRGFACTEVEFETSVRRAVVSGDLRGLPNLLSALPVSKTTGVRPLLPAILAAAAATAIAVTLPWIDAGRLDGATQSVREQLDAVATKALPAGTRIVNPLAQLRQSASARQKAERGLGLVANLFEGLQHAPGVELTRLELASDGDVRASLIAQDLSLLQPLRDHLASTGAAISETPGDSQPNIIPVELSVKASR